MYCPALFREQRRDVLWSAIRAHPLATLITCGASGLVANPLPFVLRVKEGKEILAAHLSKANEQVADLGDRAPTLVVFHGPQAYVSPSWYSTKAEHGRVVPTWNYIVVQVRGTPTVIRDPAWLRDHLDELTVTHEAGRPEPWAVTDAPPDFIAKQLNGIVGIEVPIESIEGKWKVSQNQPSPNRRGVSQGLRLAGAVDLADIVESDS